MKYTRLFSLLLILALFIAACGPAETNTSDEAAAPANGANETMTAEEMAEEEMANEMAEEEMTAEEMAPGTIVDVAVADGRFNTLVTAVTAAGLADTLAGEGSFTVFAPTDDAFAALPAGTLDALLADPQGELTNILLYHVVDGTVPAETVITLDSATTLLGEDVSITVADDGSVFLNDTVQVVTTDIQAANGIIHVIDAVLLPAS